MCKVGKKVKNMSENVNLKRLYCYCKCWHKAKQFNILCDTLTITYKYLAVSGLEMVGKHHHFFINPKASYPIDLASS